ncbi:MAG: hypothetical protein NT080_05045 [Spirochaetes bacterium]|nr:hypothetical protein [Spirochaetota bacterium]
MKKLVQTLLVFFMLACPLIAQSDLTPEQQKQFKEQSLSVQIPSWRLLFPNSDRNWIATQGSKALSESSFYEIAGFPEEAKQATAHKRIGFLCLIGSIPVFYCGVAWLNSGITTDPFGRVESISTDAMLGGLICFTASAEFLLNGLDKLGNSWSTVGRAAAATEEFNSKLLQRIENGGETRVNTFEAMDQHDSKQQ